MEVEVSPKDLIGAFPAEDHFEPHRLYAPSQQIHGHSCSDLPREEADVSPTLLLSHCFACRSVAKQKQGQKQARWICFASLVPSLVRLCGDQLVLMSTSHRLTAACNLEV